MNRRQFLAISSATVAVGPLHTLLRAQAAQPAPQPRFESIRRNVGYFTARGGTIGWLSSKEALVTVDTQYLDTAKMCVDGLRERAGGRGTARLRQPPEPGNRLDARRRSWCGVRRTHGQMKEQLLTPNS